MKLSCSTLGFAHTDLAGALEGIAALGFEYADILALENWVHINPSDLARDASRIADEVVALLEANALTASGLNTSITTPLPRCPVPLGDQEESEFAGLLELAKAVGSPVITHQPGRVDPELGLDQSLANAGRALAELVKRAEGQGMRLALEIHGQSLVEQIETAWRIAEAAPGLGFTLDPSHFACMEIPLSRVKEILPNVYHVHLRNGVAGSFMASMAEGTVDFPELKRMLAEHGYSSYATIEYISNRDTDVTQDILTLKKLWEGAPSYASS